MSADSLIRVRAPGRPIGGVGVRVPLSKSILIREIALRYVHGMPLPVLPPEARGVADVRRMLDVVEALRRRRPFLNVEDAGTVARFAVALAAVTPGRWTIDGVPRLRRRPMAPLLQVLRQWGVPIQCHETADALPVTIQGRPTLPMPPREVEVDGSKSSQFASALVLIAPRLRLPVVLRFNGRMVSFPYFEMTLAMARRWGLMARWQPPGLHLLAIRSIVPPPPLSEGDWSGALFFALMPVVDPRVKVTMAPLRLPSLQGDAAVIEQLRRFGLLRVRPRGDSFQFEGIPSFPQNRWFEYDGTDTPDAVIPLAVALALRRIPFTVRGVAHLDLKESRRLDLLCRMLRRLGAHTDCGSDHLRVAAFGPPAASLHIHPQRDHRMAMTAGLISLKVPDVMVHQPGCVEKSFPDYWRQLEALGWKISYP